MSFKDISYLKLWRPLYLVEQKPLCNFDGSHNEEQFFEIIFEFGPVAQEMPFKDISYLELWRPFCSMKQNH